METLHIELADSVLWFAETLPNTSRLPAPCVNSRAISAWHTLPYLNSPSYVPLLPDSYRVSVQVDYIPSFRKFHWWLCSTQWGLWHRAISEEIDVGFVFEPLLNDLLDVGNLQSVFCLKVAWKLTVHAPHAWFENFWVLLCYLCNECNCLVVRDLFLPSWDWNDLSYGHFSKFCWECSIHISSLDLK